MQPRSRSRSVSTFAVAAILLALVLGGIVAMMAQISQAAPEDTAFLRPPYPEPQFIPAIVHQPPPTAAPPTATPVPSPTPFVAPIFVGERNGWDGDGFINFETYQEVGTHLRRTFDQMVAADVIRSDNLHWYDPNPNDWEQEQWYSHYKLSTGEFVSSSVPSSSVWKFSDPWFIRYPFDFQAGQDVLISGNRFSVAGPYDGVTTFGAPVSYWQLVNRERVLYYENGPWKQYVLPGELVLHYDAGQTRLQLYRDVMRREYYNSSATPYNVRYVHWLTVSNAFPETGRTADPSLSLPTPEPRGGLPEGTQVLSAAELEALRGSLPAGAWRMGP